MEIKALSPSLLDAFLDFFDHRAFCDHPEWDGCYCVFFHNRDPEQAWMQRTKSMNRERAIELVTCGAMKGYLAFDGDTPVGWMQVNRKEAFCFNKTSKGFASPEDESVVSIVCFVIAKAYRRQGIARQLLQRAVNDYRQTPMFYLEAYPVSKEDKDAENYHGPVALYLQQGFQITRQQDEFTVVRYPLKKSPGTAL